MAGTCDYVSWPPDPWCDKQIGICLAINHCEHIGWEDCDVEAYLGWRPSYERNETSCDNLDNDCDGSKDEGCKRDFIVNDDNAVRAMGGCVENWRCGEYRPCVNTIQKRVCEDVNNCGTINDRPQLEKNCYVARKEAPTTPTEEVTKGTIGTVTGTDNEIGKKIGIAIYSFIGFLLLLLFTFSLVLHYRRLNVSKHKKYLKILEPKVKEALDKGYGVEAIRADLLVKGWPPEVIDKVLKKKKR